MCFYNQSKYERSYFPLFSNLVFYNYLSHIITFNTRLSTQNLYKCYINAICFILLYKHNYTMETIYYRNTIRRGSSFFFLYNYNCPKLQCITKKLTSLNMKRTPTSKCQCSFLKEFVCIVICLSI